MSSTDSEHDCALKKCVGKGLNGLKLQCNRCDRSYFVECLIKEDEIFELLRQTHILNLKDDELVSNTSNENLQKFNTVIGKNTLIEFACKICKKECKTKDKFKKMENEIKIKSDKMKMLELKLKEMNEKEQEWIKLNSKLSGDLKESRKIIQEMTDEREEPNEWMENDEENNLKPGFRIQDFYLRSDKFLFCT